MVCEALRNKAADQATLTYDNSFLDALASLVLMIETHSLTHWLTDSEIGNWQSSSTSVLFIDIEIVTE